jgi:hypothetical protein
LSLAWYSDGCGLDGQSLIPGRGKRFLLHSIQMASGPTHTPIQWVPAVSPGLKRSRRQANNSAPSSADIKNRGAIPPLPHTYSWNGD